LLAGCAGRHASIRPGTTPVPASQRRAVLV
jgi:hypothetical protein